MNIIDLGKKIQTVIVSMGLIVDSKITIKGIPDIITFRTDIEYDKTSRIIIGNKFCSPDYCKIEARDKGIVSLGNHTFFNRGCIISSRNRIQIGDNCSFGPNCLVYDHDHAFSKDGIIHGEYNSESISIGNNVWIGANVIILKGSVIGDNCVIGANSFIKGCVPSNSLAYSQNSLVVTDLKGKFDE